MKNFKIYPMALNSENLMDETKIVLNMSFFFFDVIKKLIDLGFQFPRHSESRHYTLLF